MKGGAALAAYRLHRAMLHHEDCRSSMVVLRRDSRDPSVFRSHQSSAAWRRAERLFLRWRIERDRGPYREPLSRAEIFSDDRGMGAGQIVPNIVEFDIVQLHWIAEFLHYGKFFSTVPPHIPLVWRLADMNPFTGGCHYDARCGRFEQACGCCPMLDSQQPHDLSSATWKRKARAFATLSDGDLHLVALNEWMAGQVKRSSLFRRFECTVIPNGVDLQDFRPVPRLAAKEALGIPGGSEAIAFVSDSVNNVRKGFRLLVDALNALRDRRNLVLLVVGESDAGIRSSLPAVQVGRVQSVPFLRQIYSAADLFVIPSLEDNQPNTALEAMACGTPVVGFATGGIPELVEHGRTGLLAAPGDVSDLARAIERFLDDEQLRATMARAARTRAETVFPREKQVVRYLELYTRLLAQRRATRPAAARLRVPLDHRDVRNPTYPLTTDLKHRSGFLRTEA